MLLKGAATSVLMCYSVEDSVVLHIDLVNEDGVLNIPRIQGFRGSIVSVKIP